MVQSKLEPPVSTLRSGLSRLQAPFAEIATDLLGLIAVRPLASLRRDSQLEDATAEEQSSALAVASTRHGGRGSASTANADFKEKVLEALFLLKKRLGLGERHAWAACLAAAAVLTGPAGFGAGTCWVTLWGLALPLKAIAGGVSCAMAAGSAASMKRFAECEALSRIHLQRRWASGLLLCGGMHVVLVILLPGSCGGAACLPASFYSGSGAAVITYIRDKNYALLMANLAYLAGVSGKESMLTSGLSIVNTAGLALLASVSSELYRALNFGVRCLAPPPPPVQEEQVVEQDQRICRSRKRAVRRQSQVLRRLRRSSRFVSHTF